MPTRPPRICACGKRVPAGETCACRRQAKAASDAARPSARQRGYTTSWQRARAYFLAAHPLCAECERQGRITAAAVVDHIVPHKGDDRLFWDESNWQPMCKPCHDRKTLQEGAFGRQTGRWSPTSDRLPGTGAVRTLDIPTK